MEFIHVLRSNFNRAIFSWRFLLYSSLIILAMLIIAFPLMQVTGDAIDLLGATLGGTHGGLMLVIATLPLLPYTLSFATEWEERAVLPAVIRAGAKRYAIGKVFASVISAFLSLAVSCVVFIMIMSFMMPIYQSTYAGESYHVLLDNDKIVTFLIFAITDYALRALTFSAIAFFVSTLIPNKFVTLTAPVVVYFFTSRLTSSAPLGYRVMDFFEGTYIVGSPLANLMLKAIVACGITLILSISSVFLIKRRIQNV